METLKGLKKDMARAMEWLAREFAKAEHIEQRIRRTRRQHDYAHFVRI